MAENGHRSASTSQSKSAGGEENGATASSPNEDELEAAKMRLRKRWELASVLNFLGVFEPLIEGNLKLTAEEIEMALIKPDSSLAKFHVALLKGIPPVNKNLSKSDAWVTILCKKLDEWWPWVAEGEIPLTVDKGEEIARYKELDPTERLLMLKALCEVRTEQDDLISYINDLLKQGSDPSSFRLGKVGEDGNNTSYWYDGNDVIGHRLYREINKSVKSKYKSKTCIDPPTNNLQWDTLATNLDEFRKVLEEFSSSKIGGEVAVCTIIETSVIPALEKLQKKKERALKRQQRQDALLNGFHAHAYVSGTTRSCRVRKPVNYTFDDYDQAINEAIQMTKKGNAVEKRKRNDRGKGTNMVSDTDSDDDDGHRDGSVDSMDKDHESDEMEHKENADNSEEYLSSEKDDRDSNSEVDKSDLDPEYDNVIETKRLKLNTQEQTKNNANGSIGKFTRRLNSLRNHSNCKKSAMESSTPSDSDCSSSSKDPSQQDNSSVAADSEDETSS